jgi:hypothetical protein
VPVASDDSLSKARRGQAARRSVPHNAAIEDHAYLSTLIGKGFTMEKQSKQQSSSDGLREKQFDTHTLTTE